MVRNQDGMRVGERRAQLAPALALPMPAAVVIYEDELIFVSRLAVPGVVREDHETGRLLTRLQAGDATALPALYGKYQPRLHHYLSGIVGDRDEAADLVQDVFLRVLEKAHTFEFRGVPFRHWLYRVARNVALSRVRQLQHLVVSPPWAIDDYRDERIADLDASGGHWSSDVADAVSELPLAQQHVLALRFVFDLSGKDTARIVGRPETAIRQLQSRAYRSLRARVPHHAPGRSKVYGARQPLPIP